jgi:hypothetical protein
MSDSKKMYKGKVFLLKKDYGGFGLPENFPMQGEFVPLKVIDSELRASRCSVTYEGELGIRYEDGDELEV